VQDRSGVAPVGSVVGQSPVPNAPLPPGATVTLRVAGEPPALPVPPAVPPASAAPAP
jgi:beta-lactam-binding protein with PASTA domain